MNSRVFPFKIRISTKNNLTSNLTSRKQLDIYCTCGIFTLLQTYNYLPVQPAIPLAMARVDLVTTVVTQLEP